MQAWVRACLPGPDAMHLLYMHWIRVRIVISTHDKPSPNSLVWFTLCHVWSEIHLHRLLLPGIHSRAWMWWAFSRDSALQARRYTDPPIFIPAWGRAFVLKWKFCWFSSFCSLSFPTQETLEDIDKNDDGHVDEDEYIGKWMSGWWAEYDATAFHVQAAAAQSHSSPAVDYDSLQFYCCWSWIDVGTRVWTMSLWR